MGQVLLVMAHRRQNVDAGAHATPAYPRHHHAEACGAALHLVERQRWMRGRGEESQLIDRARMPREEFEQLCQAVVCLPEWHADAEGNQRHGDTRGCGIQASAGQRNRTLQEAASVPILCHHPSSPHFAIIPFLGHRRSLSSNRDQPSCLPVSDAYRSFSESIL